MALIITTAVFYLLIYFGHASGHAGLDPCPLQWKHEVLTTVPPGNSQQQLSFIEHLPHARHSTSTSHVLAHLIPIDTL